MPIYAYRCEACGFAKELLQKISDAPLTDCESCGKPAMKKQVTAAGFQLKGSGWYVTDFRNNGTGNGGAAKAKTDGGDAAGSTNAASAESGAASTPSTPVADSKPAAPAAT